MSSDIVIKGALQAGGAARLLDELPEGLESLLDGGFSFGFGSIDRYSLSGGEVCQYDYLMRVGT
jgi:hypothetical protein